MQHRTFSLSLAFGLFTAAALASAPLQSAEPQPELQIFQVKRLSLVTAVRIAQGAIDACREKGIQVGVTVTDRDGIPQVVLRDTIAAPLTLKISQMKAYTAANFNAATGAMGERANTPIGRVEGLVMSAGGLPITAGGSLLGAVGVSGAPSGATDEECAQAGLSKVMDELEMAP